MNFHIKDLDYSIPPTKFFDIIKNNDWSIFLNSNYEKYSNQRFDILTSNPIDKIILDHTDRGSKINKDNIFEKIQNIIKKNQCSSHKEIPFCGGAIGFMSYDYGNELHNIETKNIESPNYPLVAFGIYDWCITYDHLKKKSFILYHKKNEIVNKIINYKFTDKELSHLRNFKSISSCESNMTYDLYKSKIKKILSYINKGDCYQVNLAQRFSLGYEGDEYSMYEILNSSFASPYSAYMNYPFGKILSFSPERFLSIQNNIVETKPIKGTRPRSKDPEVDKMNLHELKTSDKDRAENLMIVDLLRNDLGINCKNGSIKVDKLFEIETFANVHHLVSTIKGEVDESSSIYNLIKDAFPGGSITGAPKLRSMQIIDELEPNNRSVYCGSIGYISFDEKVDLNISIRTMLAVDNNLYFWGGGGIVTDSDIKSEYNESIAKVKPLLDTFSD
jgi:para-aminobenzoate synthetase component 1